MLEQILIDFEIFTKIIKKVESNSFVWYHTYFFIFTLSSNGFIYIFEFLRTHFIKMKLRQKFISSIKTSNNKLLTLVTLLLRYNYYEHEIFMNMAKKI